MNETPGDHSKIDFTTHVILQSNDARPVEYIVAREVAKMSTLVRDIIEDREKDVVVVPLHDVNSRTLHYVLEYCEYHCLARADPIERPLKSRIEDVVSEWDRRFLFTDLVKDGNEAQHELLVDCVMAAKYLNVRDLLELTCATLASMIRGKTPEQVRELFGIEQGFSAEEADKLREDHRWVEDI